MTRPGQPAGPTSDGFCFILGWNRPAGASGLHGASSRPHVSKAVAGSFAARWSTANGSRQPTETAAHRIRPGDGAGSLCKLGLWKNLLSARVEIVMSKSHRNFASALTNPDIEPFLNKGRLISSPEFQAVLEKSIEAYRKDRNWDRLRKLAMLFRNSKYFLALICFIADHADMKFRFKDEVGVQFLPLQLGSTSPKYQNLENYLVDPELQKPLATVRREAQAKKHRRISSGGDAMLLRIPGSFESSKK